MKLCLLQLETNKTSNTSFCLCAKVSKGVFYEAIVVIDGDIDGSEAVVASYQHLPVRCIVLPENRGRVTALNTGFAAATGEVLIRADDDFELSPGHLAAHVGAHEQGRVGVVGLPLNIAPDNTTASCSACNQQTAVDCSSEWLGQIGASPEEGCIRGYYGRKLD